MVYSLKQRHSVLWIFHATHHVKETTNNDRCNISLNKCPHSNKHPLAKKKVPTPKATKSNKHPTKKSPPLLPILGKPVSTATLFITPLRASTTAKSVQVSPLI